MERGCRYIAAQFITAYKSSLCFIGIGGDEFCVIMRKDLDKVSLMMNTRLMLEEMGADYRPMEFSLSYEVQTDRKNILSILPKFKTIHQTSW